MKTILFLLIFLFINGCVSDNAQVNISVIKAEEHPFLVDHSRYLLVKKGDKEIERIKLYPETGSGQTTILVESSTVFTIIDCNGFWYQIDKHNAKVSDLGWNWMEPVPNGKILKYKYNKNIGKHDFMLLDKIELSEVYLVKDPEKP